MRNKIHVFHLITLLSIGGGQKSLVAPHSLKYPGSNMRKIYKFKVIRYIHKKKLGKYQLCQESSRKFHFSILHLAKSNRSCGHQMAIVS